MNALIALLETLQQRRRYVTLLIVLVANALLFVVVTHRLATKQDRLTDEQAELTFQLEQKTAELSELAASQAVALRNDEAVRRFWDDVVRTRVPGLTEAWEEIDRLAGETRVHRGRTTFARELLDVGLEQIKASMPVEGSYFDLVRFINRVERSSRFFLVEEIRLAKRDRDNFIVLDCSISFFLKSGLPVEGAGP